ncbi:MAG: tetratricopeptide repeat protein [Desulfomonile tiedjei]|nr:tetratricopeptide repeat protein [Desulfomonile tiedjei]
MKILAAVTVLTILLLPLNIYAIAEGPTWKQTLAQAVNLKQQGDWADALREARTALTKAEQSFGRDSLNASKSHILLGELYAQRGKYPSAEIHYLKAIRIRNDLFGANHVSTIGPLTLLAESYANQGKPARAGEFFLRAVKAGQNADDPQTARALLGLAALKAGEGRHQDSVILFTKAFELCDRSSKYGEPLCLVAVRSLIGRSDVHMARGEYWRAATSYEKALGLLESKKHPDGLLMYSVLKRLGDAYRNAGSPTLASNYYRRAIAVQTRESGPMVVMAPSYNNLTAATE